MPAYPVITELGCPALHGTQWHHGMASWHGMHMLLCPAAHYGGHAERAPSLEKNSASWLSMVESFWATLPDSLCKQGSDCKQGSEGVPDSIKL
jgi:hypothetical protein